MKTKIVLAGIAFALVSCAGSPEEETAKRFCDCAGDFTALITKMKENPESRDEEEYKKVAAAFQECADPGGELKKKEEAMTAEERKAYGEKMQSLVKASCPDVAKAMGMDN